MFDRRRTSRVAPAAPLARARIAVLEDDIALREDILLPGLVAHGFEVEGFPHPSALQLRATAGAFDALVLDIGLPGDDGLAVARRLRAISPIGIVVLTGRQSLSEQVQGLAEAVDAWLVKPVEIELLAATLASVLRRIRMHDPLPLPDAGTGAWRLTADDWCLLSPAGRSVTLSRSERSLLRCLFDAVGESVSRERLLAELGMAEDSTGPHRLDMLIHRLRRKIADEIGRALPLRSVRGHGYLLVVQGDQARAD
jgi:DNA-binding response OmpR family regulator